MFLELGAHDSLRSSIHVATVVHETSMHPGPCTLNRESVNHMKGSTNTAHAS